VRQERTKQIDICTKWKREIVTIDYRKNGKKMQKVKLKILIIMIIKVLNKKGKKSVH
jgi:hypothetical protein